MPVFLLRNPSWFEGSLTHISMNGAIMALTGGATEARGCEGTDGRTADI